VLTNDPQKVSEQRNRGSIALADRRAAPAGHVKRAIATWGSSLNHYIVYRRPGTLLQRDLRGRELVT
jgi:hypothetical protein